MRYVVYGAGAIGGGIGALLARAGREVVLIARGAHLARLRTEGLHLRWPAGDETLRIPAVAGPDEVDWRPGDAVLLTMKGQDTLAALEALRAAAGTEVPVVCVQNGVANERMALRRFAHVYATVVQMPATHLEPGEVVVHAAGTAGMLDTGRFPEGVDGRAEQVCADLEAAGFAARADPAVMRLKYAKLLRNLGNAVQAVCGIDRGGGEGAGDGGRDAARELGRALREEALRCYEAAGIDCAGNEEFRARAAPIGREGSDDQSRFGGSSWQSLARGTRSIEADYLNGEIVLLGALHGVPTPLNRTLRDLAVDAAREGREPGWLTPAEVLARAGVE